jgi:hypothetical protein
MTKLYIYAVIACLVQIEILLLEIKISKENLDQPPMHAHTPIHGVTETPSHGHNSQKTLLNFVLINLGPLAVQWE